MSAAPATHKVGAMSTDVVFLHGFGADRLAWLATTPSIQSMRLHTLDLPGHGESAADVGDGLPATLVDGLLNEIEHTAGTPVHLVGHSLGGGLAILLARARPDIVASLFLLAPAGLGAGVAADFLDTYPRLDASTEMTSALQRLVSRSGLISKPMVQYALTQLRRRGRRESLARIAAGIIAAEHEFRHAAERLAEASMPRFVVWGEDDRINPPDRHALEAFGPHRVLARTGHLPQVESPREVNVALNEFLDSARA